METLIILEITFPHEQLVSRKTGDACGWLDFCQIQFAECRDLVLLLLAAGDGSVLQILAVPEHAELGRTDALPINARIAADRGRQHHARSAGTLALVRLSLAPLCVALFSGPL